MKLFFPTLHKSHWFIFLVDLCAHKFIFLDSKYDGDSTYHRTIKHMMIENFKRAWNDAGLRNMGYRHYETAYPNLPKQEGCDACGIFVLNWLENWRSRNALQSVFTHDMVQDARIRFAVDILFSEHNILDEGKRIVKDL
uniref:Ubiquitin-like protease family profile domain-containing protein n=1 Tax=Aegilops tauschii subsp. strangulata TaxID=200361 RepID=A0A453LY07_AEGTS